MSIVLELERGGRKAGHVCARSYRNGPGCPLIVRTSSEDVLSATVFGTLRHLRPSLWLRPLLNLAFQTRRFSSAAMRDLSMGFWEPVLPPSSRANTEGVTEVDVLVRFGDVRVFVEAKYRSPLATRTKNDPTRDQLARLLDVAYAATIDSRMFTAQPYVLVVGTPDEEPALVTRYRSSLQLAEALDRVDDAATRLLAHRVGYASWTRLAQILTQSTVRARDLERRLLMDVVGYIEHRVRIYRSERTESQQGRLPVVCETNTPTSAVSAGDAGGTTS